ncbi:primosomal protein N' [Erysipelothrix urinaevulpis]|uniref:replication restart helicase PriA n=1 Tax=Erysipelothrix urinaevulpis TaxID=2683717 RepID=UPI001357F6AC|nr:primosomal protein N' [Erysipelothrix urinaevulpis]
MKYYDIVLEDGFFFQDAYTYKSSNDAIKVGMRVMVTIQNRERVGFVVKAYEPISLPYEVLPIKEVIDEEVILNQELMDLAYTMAHHYVAPTISCFQTILPNKLRPKSNHRPIKMVRMVRLNPNHQHSLTPKQAELVNLLETKKRLSYTQARKFYSNVKVLVEKGVLEAYEIEAMYEPQEIKQETFNHVLTQDQESAISKIKLGSQTTYLLHGVTGSGKTEVYLHVAEKALKNNQQVLIMVPEISLTPQMIERVSKRFGRDVAIYHSGLNDQEKYEQYKRVKEAKVKLIVGTRSSIFLPFTNLGLIVMDEEHDTSYKQGNTPYYHTRDIAQWRQKTHNCPLVLGSASPSLESYARALRNVYTLIELSHRINHQFPKVTLVDTNQQLHRPHGAYLSAPLENAIQHRLEKKEQVVLLLNRRGYLPILKDVKTQKVLECPHCDVALNYHKFDHVLRCHICGYQSNKTPTNMTLTGQGMGTERFAELIQHHFPSANVLRMDADTTRRKGSHAKILSSFIHHEYDILIGTQMIAKGLDIPNVTLVGIVNADAGLVHDDYRSVEQSFATLLQASGRSGRGDKVGEVVLQTFNQDHYAIVCAVHQKYKHFFKQEMMYRKLASYPPYSFLISVVFYDEKEEKAQVAAELFDHLFIDPTIQKIGPTGIRRLSNRYRVRVILKGKDLDTMINKTNEVIQHYRQRENVRFTVDVNPMGIES